MAEPDFWWMRTVGASLDGDPRDGELHQVFSDDLPEHQDIEPWDDRDEQADEEIEAILRRGHDPRHTPDRYWRNPNEAPETHEDGRPIWNYHYHPHPEAPSWSS
jgi:hypothetical protein